MLIAAAEVEGRGPLDVRLEGGRIAEIAPRLVRRSGEPLLEAAGGALLPGLHDHHVHLFALAAALDSVACGPPTVGDREGLARALRAARPRAGWLRGVGYHDSVAGPLGRNALDAWVPELPLRIQHRSGALWMLNSPALARLGLDAGDGPPGVERDATGRATGRLFRLDGWLRERLGAAGPPSLCQASRHLAACGVTGVTDATPTNGAAELEALGAALDRGALLQRVVVMGRADCPAPQRSDLVRGAVKVLLDDAALPPFDELVAAIADAHADGRALAVHCVTRAQLVFATAAGEAAGARPGDRIEHASVAPPDAVAQLARLPLTVVTQPNFVRERGDAYLEDVEPAERPWLYRAQGLVAAGIALGGGTDAPFGEPDPWAAMWAAVERRTASGRALGAQEALVPERALALFTTPAEAPGGAPRRVVSGAPADLCLLALPWAEARRAPSREAVRATLRCGRVVFPLI